MIKFIKRLFSNKVDCFLCGRKSTTEYYTNVMAVYPTFHSNRYFCEICSDDLKINYDTVVYDMADGVICSKHYKGGVRV